MTTIIYQGDQYYIPLTVRQNGVVLTPENVDGIKVSIGGNVQEHPGELGFDGNECWLFNLTADMSKSMVGQVPGQIQINKGAVIQHSPKFVVEVDGSLFKGGL
jgi:hypothetical protein